MSEGLRLAFVAVIPPSGADWPIRVTNGAAVLSGGTQNEGLLSIADAEPPENTNSDRPWVLRARLTFRTTTGSWFVHVDRSLMSAIRAGDELHIVRTPQGGVGLSVLRHGDLILAAGAVSAVPLGRNVSVRIEPALWDAAIAATDPAPGSSWLPKDVYWREIPVEMRLGGELRVFFRRNETINGIHVFVKHAAISPYGQGGSKHARPVEKNECIALARENTCSRIAVITSAYLLAHDGLDEVRDA